MSPTRAFSKVISDDYGRLIAISLEPGREDLNVAGMANRHRHLGRRLADAGLGELRRQLAYKTFDRGHRLVAVDRFFPSSKTCSDCGAVKAKLPLWERVFVCDDCGARLDRDINAARGIAREAVRLLGEHQHHDNQQEEKDGTGLRPDSENAAPRPCKTSDAKAEVAGSPEGGTKRPPSRRAAVRLGRDVGNGVRNGRWERRDRPRVSCRT
jgi:hypothetical protein